MKLPLVAAVAIAGTAQCPRGADAFVPSGGKIAQTSRRNQKDISFSTSASARLARKSYDNRGLKMKSQATQVKAPVSKRDKKTLACLWLKYMNGRFIVMHFEGGVYTDSSAQRASRDCSNAHRCC